MSLKHSLLVLLAENPASGYELSQQFKSSVGYFWNASHQQIYQQLKAMCAEGLLSVNTQAQTDRPDKKIYRMTELGRQTMVSWLSEPAPLVNYKDALLLKLYGGSHVPTPILRDEMRRHQAMHRKNLQKLRAIQADYQNLPPQQQQQLRLPYLTLKRGIGSEESWLSWAEETLAELERMV